MSEASRRRDDDRSDGWRRLFDAPPPRPGAPVGPPLSDPVDDDDHVRGSSAALVTLVEYADFECLHCSRALPALTALLKEFSGTLRLVFRHFPLEWEHPNAWLAALASEAAARQGRFWEMHDELYRNQLMLHRDALPAHAASIGLDIGRFAEDLDDPVVVHRVQRDIASGRRNLVRGTPTVFIDGVRQSVPLLPDALRSAVGESAMRRAERMLRGED